MTLKRIYSLRTQKFTHRYENVSKMGVCMLLVLLVICGLIGSTWLIVKNAASHPEEKRDQIIYHAVGSNEIIQANKTVTNHPDIKNDYLKSSVAGKEVSTSSTAEFTSTTIESPLSTSTMPSKEIPARFLIVNTFSAIDISNSDSDYSTAGSSNDYVQLTTKNGIDESVFVKRSTERDFMNDADITPDVDYIDAYLQWTRITFNEDENPISENIHTERPNERDQYTTQKTKAEAHSDHQTCTTNYCKQSTSRMLALVNHTAEPCEDFYSYACGGFDINHFKEFTVNDKILETLPDVSTLDLAVSYKKLYHYFVVGCTKYKNGDGLKQISKMLYNLCQNHTDNLTDLLADIIMTHPQKTLTRLLPLFDVAMEVGPDKTLIPTVSLPKLNSLLSEDDDDLDLYERSCLKLTELKTANKKNKTLIQEAYKACIQDRNEYFKNLEKSIFLLQIFDHLQEFKKKQMIQKTLQFIEQNIIDEFGFISDKDFKNANYEVALNWLNSAYPKIEWNRLFEKLFGIEVAKGITEVRLTHSAYLVKIFEFYSRHSFENIKTSLLSMIGHDMYVDFIEPISANDRYKYCSTVAMKLMPDIASMLYLENFSSLDIVHTEQKLKLILEKIISTFNASLNENIWVNENVRQDVSNKIAELNVISNPYPGFSNFDENYNKLCREVNITTYDYISNVFALKRVVRRRMYDTYGKSATSSEIIWNYLAWPISDSPIRITEITAIVLPTSLIAKFTQESQKIEEFSTIGFLVAQEISRFLYTDKASKLFINENDDFKANAEIHLKDPAYSLKPNIFGVQLNEMDIASSQHSRFIDDVALRVTFDAYDQYQSLFDQSMPWTDYSFSKIFYLLTSQQFCKTKESTVKVAINLIHSENLPNYFRINSIMMNSESFLNAFECQN